MSDGIVATGRAKIARAPSRDGARDGEAAACACGDMPPLEAARVTRSYAECALRTAAAAGADLAALGAEIGLDLARGVPDVLPVRSYLAFLDAASRRLDRPLFGLEVGLNSRVADAKAYSMVLMACRDLRTIVEQVQRFEPLAQDIGRTQLVEIDGVAHLRMHSPWTGLPGLRHFFDYAAAGVRVQASWFAALKLPVIRFATTFDPPSVQIRERYERTLGAPVQFNAEHNQVSFSARLLSLPVAGADVSLFDMLKQIAESRLSALRGGGDARIVNDVRARLRQQIRLGRTTLPDVAAAMGVAPRTLQRKLSEANVTFGALLDQVRRDEVKRCLLDPDLSLTEIALLLGYSEQSTFNHAFRGWFGTTPGKYRQTMRSKID